MLRMFRLRRYRAFVACAIVIVILLFRFTRTIGGEEDKPSEGFDLSTPPKAKVPPPKLTKPVDTDEKDPEVHNLPNVKTTSSSSKNVVVTPTSNASAPSPSSQSSALEPPRIPTMVLPERKMTPDQAYAEDDVIAEDIHPLNPPGRQEFPSFSTVPTTLHWEKQAEHFPVPTESMIQLPTGKPIPIPRIQYGFNDETPDAKINREKRQVRVKEEFLKAWMGYKKHAWMHDELQPVSGRYRNPFCGWAATLVDTMDTLWIMGLEKEFEEAARAVEHIDFTTSQRSDIPVFETTIRYLGGLLAAYDVSGGKYKSLLKKAVELGDILMGAFDTPNRMPVLYYRWKPAFASQRHLASQRSNLAELGSLSMEFTRLSQLTKDPRYYDAVARVTNALSEYQDRGTKLGSVFPDNVDASGCNRTAPSAAHRPVAKTQDIVLPTRTDDQPLGYKPNVVQAPVGFKPNTEAVSGDPDITGMAVTPSVPSDAHVPIWETDNDAAKAGSVRRDLSHRALSNRSTNASPASKDSSSGLPGDLASTRSHTTTVVGEWDCIPQGLTSSNMLGTDKFSMGGGQDSTYEYFPKQYLLLSGQEAKYKKLYLKTIEDVRKWMLYRPMLPDNRDILFSGAVTTNGKPETDLELVAEVEHLTCFIGGMIGMGAKIFEIEEDLELAKKLADGCVWAYESTQSGIMPEGAMVLPCEHADHCKWNETAYFRLLDPIADRREGIIKLYDTNKLADAVAAEIQIAEQASRAALAEAKSYDPVATVDEKGLGAISQNNLVLAEDKETLDSTILRPEPDQEPFSIQKRENYSSDSPLKDNLSKAISTPDVAAGEDLSDYTIGNDYHQKKFLSKTARAKAPGSGAEAVLSGDLTATTTSKTQDPVDPLRPLPHREFVEAKIKQLALPPGFVSIRSRKYILRPEAIESVWYMYRITGDTTWQDKGWNMFEAIIEATSTKYGHSAIYDVTTPRNETSQVDEMESFWLAETLKYFYLLYSTPDTISLDEWVLNTEAHPFKRGSQ